VNEGTFKAFTTATTITFGSNMDINRNFNKKAFCTLSDSANQVLVTNESFTNEAEFIELLTTWLTLNQRQILEKRVEKLEYISNRMLTALTNIAGLLVKIRPST